ncbi:unnamed protein product [Schistosoma margrebowiei]|uniref:Uncharacterized protein n=1 Tax=Schistosoma margrebowiei TaxID=48269 RepID=A0A3P8I569_9TREM|nr:unnamed protein product [Schistosoma margrebowiei]
MRFVPLGTRQLDVHTSELCPLRDSNPVSFASNTITLPTFVYNARELRQYRGNKHSMHICQ